MNHHTQVRDELKIKPIKPIKPTDECNWLVINLNRF